ncbi:MAG: T9SS type A sorting domain-containing protein, partial [Chitinophagaceae bacterium]
TTSVGRIFDGRLSYTKGSHLLYMLRWMLGDNVFFNAIRNYQTDPAVIYGFARTTDLKRNLEQTSGKNLTNFFNQWFSGQGYPSYNVQWSNYGSGNVWIKMNQVTSHASVPFFELPVALKFQNATQQATVIVDNTFNGETFIKSIGFFADTVFVDPDAWLITKNNSTSKIPAVLPVILQQFNITKNGCTALISFTTSLESNLAMFDIEYSNNGIDFIKATSINAAGNSNAERRYSFQYLMQPGKNYLFRLKIIDRNGSYTYSTVSAITNCSTSLADLLISPNPAKDNVTLYGLPDGKNIVQLFQINGQLIQTLYSTTSNLTIDLRNYSAGIFILRVKDEKDDQVSIKIIKE